MTDLPLKATLKQGAGYDAPWITVEGATPDELDQRLRALRDGGVLVTLAETAGVFHATALANSAPAEPTAPPAQQAAPQPSSGWGGNQQQAAPAQPQGQQAPRQPGGWQRNVQQHPEGKQCQACGQVLQYGETRTGKGQWKCGQYRWNNGNPNEHTLEWAN